MDTAVCTNNNDNNYNLKVDRIEDSTPLFTQPILSKKGTRGTRSTTHGTTSYSSTIEKLKAYYMEIMINNDNNINSKHVTTKKVAVVDVEEDL